ncbi:Uncharacterised protein [Mycobacterium tuberculosis]|nr:Uncharacterised protein [Mycobacterium tuberculosis]
MRVNQRTLFGVVHGSHCVDECAMKARCRVMCGGQPSSMGQLGDLRRMFKDVAKDFDKKSPRHRTRHITACWFMEFDPVPRYVAASRDPNAFMSLNIVEKAG